MKTLLALVLAGLLLGPAAALKASEIRQEPLRFEAGSSEVAVKGEIRGYQIVDYMFTAGKGQSLAVSFEPSNLSAYFNVLPSGSETAIFIGSISGNRFEGELPVDGQYTIRVYLMRSAARRNEKASYTLDVKLAGEGKKAGFDQMLELQGVRFEVRCANEGSINTLWIVPAGLEIDNSPIERTIDGTVSGAEVADLNVDGSPEIYVYVTSAGSGSYGSLVAYAANKRKSLSEIYLPPLDKDAAVSAGYMGHDEFAVVESVLARRFPVYRADDVNARPTGGMRQLQYKLVPGEAGWLLNVDRVVEY